MRTPTGIALAICGLLALAGGLALVFLLYAMHRPVPAAALLMLVGVGAWVYTNPHAYPWRYVAPGVIAALFFIVLPMAYTLAIGFTNYSSMHLLGFERATDVLRERTVGTGETMSFRLLDSHEAPRLALERDDGHRFVSAPLTLGSPQRVALKPDAGEDLGEPLPLKEVVARRDAIAQIVAVLPDKKELRMTSLRNFAEVQPEYRLNEDGTLTSATDGAVLTADHADGWWRRPDGTAVEPGFRSVIGWDNYRAIFTDPRFREPFIRVFIWTVTFAALNTLFTFSIGVVLAVALNWSPLKYRNFYRIMMFLPYAVPAFISIPVFRGLFNENLGEINIVLRDLFDISPGWFSNATLARTMVLIVNTWLGYPYMMILSMGLIQAIPSDLYEASAVVGAGPFTNFFRITLPLIARPITPLLIASFAFNFNNLTLIALLTNGAPDYLDTKVPVGATDLLASYTYRIAFQDSGQNYALACAISSIVFLIVVTLAVVNLRLFQVGREKA
jgi:maltose/maltodextrin transport system permease protein